MQKHFKYLFGLYFNSIFKCLLYILAFIKTFKFDKRIKRLMQICIITATFRKPNKY